MNVVLLADKKLRKPFETAVKKDPNINLVGVEMVLRGNTMSRIADHHNPHALVVYKGVPEKEGITEKTCISFLRMVKPNMRIIYVYGNVEDIEAFTAFSEQLISNGITDIVTDTAAENVIKVIDEPMTEEDVHTIIEKLNAPEEEIPHEKLTHDVLMPGQEYEPLEVDFPTVTVFDNFDMGKIVYEVSETKESEHLTIGVAQLQHHNGCTHTAMELATMLSKNKTVAVIMADPDTYEALVVFHKINPVINDSKYGYKAQPDGLLLWKGSFLSSDEKQTISWDKVSELTAQLIDNEDFLGIDDIAETNDDMDQLSLFGDMSVEDEPTVHDTDEQAVQNDIAPTVQTEAEPTVQVEAPAAKKPVGDKKDFVITNENLGEGGAKTKYRANVAAIASHDLDAPWKPSDMEQRRGRMVRQGNENEKVDLYRYVTEGTFDAYLYQMLENKQKFISQIMTSKSPVRSCQDLDEVSLSYAEIKALSAGNPLIKEKMDLDIEVSKLKMLKASHMNALYDLQDKVMTDLPAKIKFSEILISNIEKDIKAYSERPIVLDDKGKPAFPSIELFGKVYTDKDEAGKALIEACKQAARADITRNVEVGSYQGFKVNIGYEPMNKVYVATLSGSASYKTELGGSESGNFTRLDNALNGMDDKLTSAKQQLERLQNQLEEAMAQLDTPFPHEQELQEKSQRLDELTKQLESAADDKPTSELAEIVDPYFIEVSSEEAADKLKSSGITFEMKESEGHYIVKLNRSDKDKVLDFLEQQKKIVL